MEDKTQCVMCSVVFKSALDATEHYMSMSHHCKLDMESKTKQHHCKICNVYSLDLHQYSQHVNSDLHLQKLQSTQDYKISRRTSHDSISHYDVERFRTQGSRYFDRPYFESSGRGPIPHTQGRHENIHTTAPSNNGRGHGRGQATSHQTNPSSCYSYHSLSTQTTSSYTHSHPRYNPDSHVHSTMTSFAKDKTITRRPIGNAIGVQTTPTIKPVGPKNTSTFNTNKPVSSKTTPIAPDNPVDGSKTTPFYTDRPVGSKTTPITRDNPAGSKTTPTSMGKPAGSKTMPTNLEKPACSKTTPTGMEKPAGPKTTPTSMGKSAGSKTPSTSMGKPAGSKTTPKGMEKPAGSKTTPTGVEKPADSNSKGFPHHSRNSKDNPLIFKPHPYRFEKPLKKYQRNFGNSRKVITGGVALEPPSKNDTAGDTHRKPKRVTFQESVRYSSPLKNESDTTSNDMYVSFSNSHTPSTLTVTSITDSSTVITKGDSSKKSSTTIKPPTTDSAHMSSPLSKDNSNKKELLPSAKSTTEGTSQSLSVSNPSVPCPVSKELNQKQSSTAKPQEATPIVSSKSSTQNNDISNVISSVITHNVQQIYCTSQSKSAKRNRPSDSEENGETKKRKLFGDCQKSNDVNKKSSVSSKKVSRPVYSTLSDDQNMDIVIKKEPASDDKRPTSLSIRGSTLSPPSSIETLLKTAETLLKMNTFKNEVLPTSPIPKPQVLSPHSTCCFKTRNGTFCNKVVTDGDRLCVEHKQNSDRLKVFLGLSPMKKEDTSKEKDLTSSTSNDLSTMLNLTTPSLTTPPAHEEKVPKDKVQNPSTVSNPIIIDSPLTPTKHIDDTTHNTSTLSVDTSLISQEHDTSASILNISSESITSVTDSAITTSPMSLTPPLDSAPSGIPPVSTSNSVATSKPLEEPHPLEHISESSPVVAESVTQVPFYKQMETLNKREEFVQSALVESEGNLSKLTVEMEKLQERLATITKDRKAMLDECDKLTREYQEVLSLKQTLLISNVSKFTKSVVKKNESSLPPVLHSNSNPSCSLSTHPSTPQTHSTNHPQADSNSNSKNENNSLKSESMEVETTPTTPEESGACNNVHSETSAQSKRHLADLEMSDPKKAKNTSKYTEDVPIITKLDPPTSKADPSISAKNTIDPSISTNETMSPSNVSTTSLTSEEVFFQPHFEDISDSSFDPASIPKFTPFRQSVLCMKIHENTLFACSSDKTIRSYNLKTGEILKEYHTHQKGVTSLDIYNNGKELLLLSGSSDKFVHMINITSGRVTTKFKCTTKVMYIVVSNDFLFIAQHSGAIAVINLKSKQLVHKHTCHERNAISSITVSGSLLFTAAFDYTVVCWDIENSSKGKMNFVKLNTFKTFTNTVLCMKVHDDLLLCGSADKTLQVFNIKTWKREHCLKCHNGAVSTMDIIGKVLVTTCFDKIIRCFDLERFNLLQIYTGHKDMLFAMATKNGVIYSGSRDGSIIGVTLDLTTFYSCKWNNCGLQFGILEHLKDHVKNHCGNGVEVCCWDSCDSNKNHVNVFDHLLNTHFS